MKLRRFNPDGVAAFATYRARLTLEPSLQPPTQLLEDPALTDEVPGDLDVPARSFKNRMEAGVFLNTLIDAAGISLPERDQGLWTWLTLFYFDEVCPADGNGNRDPKKEARLIAQVDNFQRFYRHLLLGPFLIVRAHRDDPSRAIALLCKPRGSPAKSWSSSLRARSWSRTGRSLRPQHDSDARPDFRLIQARRWLRREGRAAPFGSTPESTGHHLSLYGLGVDELLHLLPKEFDRFRPAAP